MAVWLVRAGGRGQRQDFALDNNVTVIGWRKVGDVRDYPTRDELKRFLQKDNVDAKPRRISAWAGQIWNFVHEIKVGDHIALPLKGQSAVALGRVTGDYVYAPSNPCGASHVRSVKWISQDTPRSAFAGDILNSLGSLLTVSRVRAEDAEARMLAIVTGNVEPPPGPKNGDDPPPGVDLETVALDDIRQFITRNFSGHKLSDLVDAVLIAQGYQTTVSPPGPDGGVDIIAGRGPMGFDRPRLCVQVKATKEQQDIKVLRELKGVMQEFGAEQGLFVSWGGFKRTVKAAERRSFFDIRLWDDGDLVANILDHYDSFPEDLKTELPLKRIWTLVQED